MPYTTIPSMYNQVGADTNLRALMDIQDINTITSTANGLLGKTGLTDADKRARFIEYFYDKMLLDTIKLGSEHNVLLKYCKTKEVPSGNQKFLLRRWGGLTEHTEPLKEGIPPKSDMMASESFEGTFAQYGRYMEFTDRVEFNVIDPVIAHYTAQYGDVIVRTAERLARNELIALGGKNFAGSGAGNISKMVLGDKFTIADYRLQALKMARILVKPINGKFRIVCSPEHIYDLVTDPLVEKYMSYTNSAEPYKTGKPVELFNLSFEETMLDEFGYGYLDETGKGMLHSGEYESGDKHYLRVYTIVDNVEYYMNVEGNATTRKVHDVRLKDGSYIPNKITWDITSVIAGITTATADITDNTGAAVSLTAEGEENGLVGKLKAATWYELPVHKSFMFGDEFLIKTGITGRTGAKMFVKAKGSAGVLDPIDQRQSIGFKIDTLGFNLLRSEAVQVFFFVPTTAAITQQHGIAYRAYGDNWTKGGDGVTNVNPENK